MWFFLTAKQKSLTLWRRHIAITLESNGDQDKPLPTFAVKHVWRTWGIGGMVKERVCYCHSNGLEEKKRSHYRRLFVHDKSKKNKSQRQAPCPDVPSAIRPISHGSNFPVFEPDGNMEYSSHCPNIVTWM